MEKCFYDCVLLFLFEINFNINDFILSSNAALSSHIVIG